METVLTSLLWAAIAVAAGAAAAALYGRYFILPALFTGPRICRREAGGCAILFRSPNATLLGVPNSLLGLLFYALLAIGMAAAWPPALLFAAATLALVASIRLAVSLLRQGLECRICWTGHLANAVIWAILGVLSWP